MILHAVWMLMTVLRFGGVFVVFGGVVLFGIHFIGGNARAVRRGDDTVPRSSWLGPGPRQGLKLLGIGVLMLLGAMLIGWLMPDGR